MFDELMNMYANVEYLSNKMLQLKAFWKKANHARHVVLVRRHGGRRVELEVTSYNCIAHCS